MIWIINFSVRDDGTRKRVSGVHTDHWRIRVVQTCQLCCVCLSRQTKPLSFADCIGDELPVGWEEAYDPVIGPYYVDHNTSEFCCGSALLRRLRPDVQQL